ncbi:Sugar lactone lactonase YvrE [Terribacillus halophilus]|uniref:Sugar lactone lactonase YvrE n=1 Tax=Terribacillus halophilus TaxID=361279 RepID=A0A1G6IIR7_9BACI|nr:SMP-30/gluconolactonase/LRE family protein [Terribacillus halophilus]SDC06417.1 Sugar lactone lactonase YvrE [Terribacillus halophilus]
MAEAKLFLDAKQSLAEGPFWREETEELYWVDINGQSIHIYNTKTNEKREIPVDQKVGAAILKKDGGMILALENGIYETDSELKAKVLLHSPETDRPSNRFNDGKADPYGRIWAGTMPAKGSDYKGAFYRMELDQTLTRVIDGIGNSNGLAWSPDHKYFYYIDTPTGEVQCFDYDGETGEISNPRIAVSFKDGKPDGMTIDEEGKLWIAHYGGSKVSRWNPATGERLEDVHLPVSQVTSCTFGGPERKTLYITTARQNLTEEDLEKQPLAGGIFVYETDVVGAPSYRFGK